MHDHHLHCEHYDELLDEVVEQAVELANVEDAQDEHEARIQALEADVEELVAIVHALLEDAEDEEFESEDC